MLFQKPNEVNGKKNNTVHFTHLVSPISTEIFVDATAPDHKWCRKVQLIAAANPIASISNPGYFNFFLPNRGLTNPIANLTNTIGLSEVETQSRIWRLFESYMCPNILDQIYLPTEPIGIYGEIEGDLRILEHIKIEQRVRNSRIVQMKKAEALKTGNGRILCECCDFDFIKYYGSHGAGFIECHHRTPIVEGSRFTTTTDLAVVCSNCHRMLHRRRPENIYYTVEGLRELINLPHSD